MVKAILSCALAAGLAIAAVAVALPSVAVAAEFKFTNSGAYPPSNFVNGQKAVVGFDVGNEIAKRLGVKGVNVSTAWSGIVAGLLAGKYDSIIGSMTITAEREKAVDSVCPYYRFAAEVADKVLFMADGAVVEEGTPDELFSNPKQERTRTFLRKFLTPDYRRTEQAWQKLSFPTSA